jgi:hypothetical protein
MAQDSKVDLPVVIASGVMSYPLEADPEGEYELMSGYAISDDDDTMTVRYSGSEYAEMKVALERLPYGQEDILVSFCIYPTLYALKEPHMIAFTNAYDDDVEYLTAAHICEMGSQKRTAPLPTSFSYHKLLKKYYGAVQLAFTYF